MNYSHGTPVWLHIPAASVSRARTFYSNPLNLQFRTGEKDDAEKEPIIHFVFLDPTLITLQVDGGIVKIKEGKRS